jgi:hypothetical protein
MTHLINSERARCRRFGIAACLGLALLALSAAGCKDARRGQSSANENPVSDGDIVLLKRKNEVAAFILHHQKAGPEQTDFSWYYRSDGKGTFPVGDPAVSSGYVSNATVVAFKTFSVEWSIHGGGSGWVYFSTGPTEMKSADYLMCVTDKSDLKTIDANDASWNYRARPHVNIRALLESQVK